MTIPLNDRPVQDRVIALKQAVETYWRDARNFKLNVHNAAAIAYFPKQKNTMTAIVKLLDGDAFSAFVTAFRSTYGWSQAEWDGFASASINVHGTLVPAVLTRLKANESSITESTIDATTGAIIFTNPISGQLLTDITSDLQAVEDQFTL